MIQINLVSQRAMLSTLIYRKATVALATHNNIMTHPEGTDARKAGNRWLEAFERLKATFHQVCANKRPARY